MSAGCVDELLLYLAPVLLGDAAGMVRLPMLEHLDAARRYEFIEAGRVGADLCVRARVADTWQELMQRVALPALS
ncbi:Riboflavin biosynthesis protein RibD [compost metagenome]